MHRAYSPRLLVLPFLFVSMAPLAVAGCAVEQPSEEVDEASSDLVQFPAAAFENAPALAFGDTSAAIDTSRTKWGTVKLSGTTGDEIVATVASTTPDRMPRAYLVEKRADGKYVAVLAGTQSTDGVVKAKLTKTQDYFIVFRDLSRRNASFTVKLARAGALPATCTGPALLNAGFVERTPQAADPFLSVNGQYTSRIRRCNVATGCTDPVVRDYPNANVNFARRADGKWLGSGYLSVEHDGATGELKANASVTADDGRNIPVTLTGAATTSCISLAGRNRAEIDAITYYEAELTYVATTPAVAARTTFPDTPPAPDCEGQVTIPDEEVLARFPRGSSSVALGTAPIMEDSQFCHPETGCRPWYRGAASGSPSVRATAFVLSSDTLGIQFYNMSTGATSPKFELQDGSIPITSDVLARGQNPAVAHVSSISDTHVFVKEVNVYTAGTTKYRRFACIPIIPHP